MAQSYRGRFISIMKQNERRMVALFTVLATNILGEMTRRAGPDGVVPRSAVPDVQAAVGARITAFFVGRTSSGQRAPFDVLSDGTVMPLSPYMRALWQAITDAVHVPVEQQASILARMVPPDVLAIMHGATGDPFAAAKAQVREQVFRPNPLARYDPPHTWVDPNGYTLSDRIWNVAGDTRRRLDLYLERAIAEGRGVLNLETGGATGLARELEQFLVPGRALLRTRKPYGVDASFDAMRLARTEITRAHSEAAKVAAAQNPFVEKLQWNLSGSHPKPDICDDRAHGGPNSDGIYSIEDFPNIPGSTHPNCLCFSTNVLIPTDRREAIFDELRADVRRERAELVRLVGPAMVEQYTDLLLGRQMQTTRALPSELPPPVSPARIVTPSPSKLPQPLQPIGEKPIDIMSTGDPRLSAVLSPIDKEITQRANIALEEIGKVHGYKNAPSGHEIARITDRKNAVNGWFDPEAKLSSSSKKINSVALNPAFLKDNLDHVTSTTVHEMGHWLDFHVLGKGKFASEARITTMDDLWTALTKSRRYGQWSEQLASSSGRVKAYHQYVSSDVEVFARAYTQFIGERTGNESILKMIADDLADTADIKLHWEASDFVEINRAFADLLRTMELAL